MGYFELTHNVPLHKLCELRGLDLRVGLYFCPLGEIISGYQNELLLATLGEKDLRCQSATCKKAMDLTHSGALWLRYE